MASTSATRGQPEPQPAVRRVTIVDVASHAGVSVATASKALRNAYGVSPKMKARVEASIEALGYRPLASARGMRGKTFTIGVLVSDIHNSFYALVVDGMTDVVGPSGYELLVGPGGASAQSQSRMIDALIDRQMDGLVLIGPVVPASEIARTAKTVPTVVVGLHGPADEFDTVAGDDTAGAALVIDHLVGLGHSRIAYLTFPSSAGADPRTPQAVREQGYVEAMHAHGLGEFIQVMATPWTDAGGRGAAEALLALADRPTAVHAGPDVSAFGLLSELWERDVQVPGEISVVGYDNTPTAALPAVSLTSIDQEASQMGASAARLLLERIDGRTESEHILTIPRLIPRRTSAAPGVMHPQISGVA